MWTLVLVTIFLGAFLLFEVQPIVGRYVLPWFGGGPMVWTNCMLFFQVLLVGGYAYAHWLGSLRSTRRQGVIHIALLAASLLFLPLDPRGILSKQASSADPSGRILLVLAASVGGPYFMLSSTGPLLQRWFHLTHPQKSPWRLYSLSNVGSFLALLSYPFLVEPFFRLHVQSWAWSVLYAAFALLCGWIAWTLRPVVPVTSGVAVASEPGPGIGAISFWIGLSACGSILLLATTNLICQDVAVVPFLWVAPLSVYLLTFVLAFENDRWYHRTAFAVAAGLSIPACCAILAAAVAVPPWWQLVICLAGLFVACMICHGELARARPSPASLTTFYLAIAGGGALGGVFVALVCPRIFTEFSEYPFGLAGACLLGLIAWWRSGAFAQWKRANLGVRVPLMALLLGCLTAFTTMTAGSRPALASFRNFYGILRVSERTDSLNRPFRELTHGRIRHGLQISMYPQSTWPTTYFGPHSGVGVVLKSLSGAPRRVAIVGLGSGTLAAWGQPGDSFRFYEINPDVVTVAKNWFSYLKDSKARSEIVLGDARVELDRELAGGHAGRFDVLAVDAFSSDAIPLHLLTAECGDIYARHLAPGGVLLLHISNRLLELAPVARGLARHLGWNAARIVSTSNIATGESASTWVVITANDAFLQRPEIAGAVSGWDKDETTESLMWTDDFASLWHVLRF